MKSLFVSLFLIFLVISCSKNQGAQEEDITPPQEFLAKEKTEDCDDENKVLEKLKEKEKSEKISFTKSEDDEGCAVE